MRIGVIDYGVGNLGSVMRALQDADVDAVLVSDPKGLTHVEALLLPGVGSFADCAQLLSKADWPAAILEQVSGGKALLGVCVGMQLLATSSSESEDGSEVAGLGLVPGRVCHLRELGCTLRVPHAGWNDILASNPDPVLGGIPDGTDFYFVHSFAFVADNPGAVIATTEYGTRFAAAVRQGRVWGTQFHPEKSSRAGKMLLRNFAELAAC
jgi:glutamine amidotransferase